MYCMDISSNKVNTEKYIDYLRYIRHVYKNKSWTAVAMNKKIHEKHRIEMMENYHIHLNILKDDDVITSSTSHELKLILEKSIKSMQILANQQNMEIQQLTYWLEIVQNNEHIVKSITQILVESWNEYAEQVDLSKPKQIYNMLGQITEIVLELIKNKSYIEISEIAAFELESMNFN